MDTSPAELAELGGGAGHEVLRVEQVAEQLVSEVDAPAALLDGSPTRPHPRLRRTR